MKTLFEKKKMFAIVKYVRGGYSYRFFHTPWDAHEYAAERGFIVSDWVEKYARYEASLRSKPKVAPPPPPPMRVAA